MIYLQLLWSFFQVGLFSFGGGYAAMPLIQHQVVEVNPWLSMTEFADLISISQMTPGPIAINSATFVGMRIAGLGGAVVATIGCVIPSCVIAILLARLYLKYRELPMLKGILAGLRPAIVALIASAGVTIAVLAFWNSALDAIRLQNTDGIAIFLFVAALFVLRKWKTDPTYVMLGTGVVGLGLYALANLVHV